MSEAAPSSPPFGSTELGIDIVKIERISRALARHGRRFPLRILTAAEDAYVRWAQALVPNTADIAGNPGTNLNEAELRAAAESLQDAGPQLTREKLLELVIAAPSKDRLAALASLARPAMDYTFFSLLTDRIEKAAGAEKDKLTALRAGLLEATQRIDEAQQAHVGRAAELLKQVAGAKDLDLALQAVLPLVDEVFLGVLEANLRAARERGDSTTAARLAEISSQLQAMARESLPPGIRLAQSVLEQENEDEARSILEGASASIDADVLGALMGAAESLEKEGDPEGAQRLRRLHRHALGLSMRARMAPQGGTS